MDIRSLVLPVLLFGAGDPPSADVEALLRAGRYDEAEIVSGAEVAAARAAGGDALASALEHLADALLHNGRIAAHGAESAAREALAMREALHGRGTPPTARALALLGAALVAQGSPAATAAPPLDAALALQRPAGAAAVPALVARAELCLDESDARRALELVGEARVLLGTGAADAALRASVLDLAILVNEALGDWEAVAADARDALAAREAIVPGHPDSAVTYLLLGDRSWRLGSMREAGTQYAHAVALAERGLRDGHPLRTRASGRLASWQAVTGDLQQALRSHRDALAAARENLGPDHPRIGDYLNDLANALVRSGDAAAAEPHLEEALRIMQRTYGPNVALVATPLYNLALARAEQGDWDRAAVPLQDAMRLWRDAYGPQDARVLLAYGGWADVLAAGGRPAEAVAYYERAIALRVRAGERDHPQTASLEARLAQVEARLGRRTEAERHAARAEARLGGLANWRDREYAEVVALRARLGLAVPARRAAALGRARDADAVMRGHVRSTVRFLGDRRALEYVGHRFAGRDAVLAYLAAHPRDEAAARTGLELVVRSRNLVLDELASRAHGAITGEGAAARERLARAAERLATLIYRGAAQAGEATLGAAQDEYDEAERAAALLSVRPPEPELPGDIVAALSLRLPPGSALVSMCSYRPSSEPSGSGYLAFVLVPGAAAPVVVPLGPAAPIDAQVRAWQAALERLVREREADAVRAEVDLLGRRLGAALWAPIARQLRGVSRAVLVPDGTLNLVSFAALVDASGRYVLESGPTLHLVSGERDLLRDARPPHEPRLLVVANPAFDDRSALARSGAPPAAAVPAAAVEAPGGTRGAEPCDRLAALRFSPLPASQGEADALRALWTRLRGASPTLLEGSAAAEAALKRAAPAHSIVHVATHGFVIEPGCGSAPSASGPRVSPLLLSGVALAGANRRRDAAPADDDGLLTAEEIAGLDLREADWVVLSACHTGRGEVSDSEGVLGLRRALAVAGARTVIMSLWAVADEDARRWMVDLYTARFADGLDTPEAVRRASLRALARVRAEDGVGDPSRWAAFVGAGDLR